MRHLALRGTSANAAPSGTQAAEEAAVGSAHAPSRPSSRATDHVLDHHWLPAGTSQSARRRPVVSVVAKHELGPAPLDHLPLARLEHRLELIETSGRGGRVTSAIPGKPAPAVQPQPQPVQGSQRDQDDRQAGDCHEEHHSHTRLTQRAAGAFPAGVLVP